MKTQIFCERHHDISVGHRVYGHESKCAHLHGHNYRITFSLVPEKNLDNVGRVLDFSVIKSVLCQWLEDNWDHKFLFYVEDPLFQKVGQHDPDGVVGVPFNPTAENMAKYLLEVACPLLLEGYACFVAHVEVRETYKCSASAMISEGHDG